MSSKRRVVNLVSLLFLLSSISKSLLINSKVVSNRQNSRTQCKIVYECQYVKKGN